jgi:plasmid stability protein
MRVLHSWTASLGTQNSLTIIMSVAAGQTLTTSSHRAIHAGLEVTMADILLDLDDSLIQRLRRRADLNGRTLEEEIREIIVRNATFTPEERVALSDRIRAMQAGPSDLLSEDVIRESRDRR